MKKKLITILTICCMLFACLGVIGCGGSCNGCNADTSPEHVHVYSNEYSYNSESHWYECECGEGKDITNHAFVNDVCVCGYIKTHVHAYNTLKFDSKSHWYECDCGEKDGLEKHKGGVVTQSERAICEVCLQPYGNPFIREGNYIYVGKYPQTIKADNVTVGETANANGYYVGSDGEEYAKVVANPFKSDYKFSNNSVVTSGETYYFKVEPIRWRILDEENGLIVCDSIIVNKRYDDNSNNYKESEIRAWLNDEFYKTAFKTLEQSFIKTTLVDNSAASTGEKYNSYACENTLDKVFLLSYKEVSDNNYGFNLDRDRKMLTSDYSRATGAYVCTDSTNYGCDFWLLRSPYGGINYVRYVYYDGAITDSYGINNPYTGIVPAMQIIL